MTSEKLVKDWKSLGDIVIFGGTFDPPQRSHLALAHAAKKSLGPVSVVFMPAAQNPLKIRGPSAGDADRLAMLVLALAGEECFWLSDHETRVQKAPSFTVDTIRAVKAAIGSNQKLYFLAGADSVASLPKWKEPEELLGLLDGFIWVPRGVGEKNSILEALRGAISASNLRKLDQGFLDLPVGDIASTEVRQLAEKGGDLQTVVPEAVAAYIAQHGLYRVKR